MQKIINLTLLFCLVWTLAQQAESQVPKTAVDTTTQGKLSAEQIAEKYLPSVVLIVCDDGESNYSQGSGFFIKNGMILTNFHVIERMKRGKAKIVLDDNKTKEWWIEKILYVDHKNDLALISVAENSEAKTPILNLSASDKPKIGETIYVLSNPKGLTGTISQGIISSETRKINEIELLQIDAPISSGSSGGAVLNTNGEVVGIATGSLSSGQNLNFAVPSSQIKSFLTKYELVAGKERIFLKPSIQNGWAKKESFFDSETVQEENSKKDSRKINSAPTNLETEEKPTLKETALWLVDKLQGTKFIYEVEESVQNISFSQCNMLLDIRIEKKGYNYLLIQSYSPNLKFLRRAHAFFKDKQNIVVLNFTKEITEETKTYNSGYAKNKMPSQSEEDLTSKILIRVNSKEDAQRVSNGFSRLIEICNSGYKEPF